MYASGWSKLHASTAYMPAQDLAPGAQMAALFGMLASSGLPATVMVSPVMRADL